MAARERRKESSKKRRKPATTPEARENEIVSLAMDLAERQIREGTASSQVITHFLKAGSLREQLEHERIEYENDLLKARKEKLESEARVEELYGEAIRAMRSYRSDSGLAGEDESDPDVL